MASSSTIRTTARKPTVVLAGWLGCKRRSLRRYETMYADMGWNVIVQIASPLMVVKSATGLNGPSQSMTNTTTSNCIRELALDTLDQVQKTHCNGFVFHAFSNGGAFLWEEVRNIISSNTWRRRPRNNCNNLHRETDSTDKLVGLVFDSAPAYYTEQDTMMKALSYATVEEQEEGKALLEKATHEMGDAACSELKHRRAQQYWQGMLDDDANVPHLYLYSKADLLTPYKKIDELIDYRRSRFGNESVSALCFDDSPHCCHFLKHPEQYQTSLKRFLNAECRMGARSKL